MARKIALSSLSFISYLHLLEFIRQVRRALPYTTTMANRFDREGQEIRPLLRPDNSHEDNNPLPELEPKGFSPATYYCFALTFLLEMSNVLLTVPLITLFEQAICQTHYGPQQLSLGLATMGEDPCKAAPIQSELALLRGWQASFNGISGSFIAP